MPIMWSPDGKYLMTKANEQEERNYQIVLIDLDGRFGAVLGENKIPVGWMGWINKL
jgi:hypothetical protein